MSLTSLGLCVMLILANIINGSGNQCIHCIAQGEERLCDSEGESMECSQELAERYLSIFERVNSHMEVEKADKTQFKCFTFTITGQEDYYLKGCTYKSLEICENMPEQLACKTCDRKDCNSMHYSDYYDDDSGKVGPLRSSVAVTLICLLVVSIRFVHKLIGFVN